jgi:CheY-like chemotaxis protein
MQKSEAMIFIVEDEPRLQYVFEKQLNRLGYKVAGMAGNGLIAVTKVLEQQYHLVFMDVRLPGIDGITATSKIRAAEARTGRHTTIIGLTAFAERQRCLDAGMDDFLQKPVLLEQMQEVLDKWVHNQTTIEISNGEVSEAAEKHLQPFLDTDAKLKKIQEKIANLRKSVGLDVSNNLLPTDRGK